MATIKKTRKKREDESIIDYTQEVDKEIAFDPSKKDSEALLYNPETGEHILSSLDDFEDNVNKSRNMKKINLWIPESMVDDIEAVRFIYGNLTLTDAVLLIMNDFFEDFQNTEEYKLYMNLVNRIRKK